MWFRRQALVARQSTHSNKKRWVTNRWVILGTRMEVLENTAQINARDGHQATLESTPTYTLVAETVGGR